VIPSTVAQNAFGRVFDRAMALASVRGDASVRIREVGMPSN